MKHFNDEAGVTAVKSPYTLDASHSWLAVILLAAMFAMSYIDRLIMAVLANPVAQSLHLSDTQIGLLSGSSFAVLYSLACLPAAQFIDTNNRKQIVLIGVTLWSAMTIASCFAVDLASLMVARSGVALGEAVLVPGAVSMIGDLFVKERRTLPTAVFSSMAPAMGTGSFMIGGAVLGVAGLIAPHGWEPWRLTFIIVGVPGLLLALAFLLLVKEPVHVRQNVELADDVSFLGFFKYLRQHYWFYFPLMLSHAALSFFAFALLSWAPTLLIRAHGFQPAAASFIFGLVIMPSSLAAIYFWPWLAARVERKHLHRGVPTGLFAAALLALPSFVLAPLMTNKYLFIGGLCFAHMAMAASGVLPNLGFQIFSPGRMRGRASALFSLIGNLVGYGLGPVLTVYFGHLWKGPATLAGWDIAANPLARGLAIDGMIAAPIMVVCTAICLRTARRLPVVEPAGILELSPFVQANSE